MIGARDIVAGIRNAVNVSPSINQEETFTQRITTLGIHLTILAFGRLITLIGAHAVVGKLRVKQVPIFNALRKFMSGVEILGKIGLHAVDVGVATPLECFNKRRADIVGLE